ncbi:MAG: S8 family peptidase [Phycicoccus sp.]
MAGRSPEPEHDRGARGGSRGPRDVAELPPIPLVPPLLARRLHARVLDPETVSLAPGQTRPFPTVYVADTLLVRGHRGGRRARDRIAELNELGSTLPQPIEVVPVEKPVDAVRSPHAPAGSASSGDDADLAPPDSSMAPDLAASVDDTWVTRVQLRVKGDEPAKQPDAWRFLQDARAAQSAIDPPSADSAAHRSMDSPEQPTVRRQESVAWDVSLEHVLTAGSGMWGGGGVWGSGGMSGGGGVWGSGGMSGGGGVWGSSALAEYGSPGIGGRTPVVVPAADPRSTVDVPSNAPVVAVLDTGIGVHPWFKTRRPDGSVQCLGGVVENVEHEGRRIGVWNDPSRDPEHIGAIIDPLNGLVDAFCGHGTFIAGIIRQRCPEATILAIPVMASDGAALETDVVNALALLHGRHVAARGDVAKGHVDVVNLSLGMYHESPEEALRDGPFIDVLRKLSDAGVAIVTAAGNDGTSARFLPAGYAKFPDSSGQSDISGLVGVGAENPDGCTVALFSNNGEWVTTHAPGTAVVSTVPVELSGSRQASVRARRDDPVDRATVDWDDYSAGFAIWSGTSFAAPWIAGEIAAQIVKDATRRVAGKAPTTPTSRDEPAARRRPSTSTVAGRAHRALATVVQASNESLVARFRHRESR